MSCYEWEKGRILLPSKDYSKFRQEVIKAWNDWWLKVLEHAKQAVEVLRVNPDRTASEVLYDKWAPARSMHDDTLHAIVCIIPNKDGKWMMPKKQDLPLKPISKGCCLNLGEAFIILLDNERTVVWSVSENNHACDRAHDHPVAKVLFRLLSQVKWVRGTGGEIVGNNEYNQESDYAGGGGNFVKQTYGQKSPVRYCY